jgi:hypothetical protein
MTDAFVASVCELVDAVLYAQATCAGAEDGNAVTIEVNRVEAVLERLRAEPAFSAWADARLRFLGHHHTAIDDPEVLKNAARTLEREIVDLNANGWR